jgi:flagellar hook protein FlgE
VDGAWPGTLNGISIGSDGKITGKYSNGKTKVLWQIPIAKFKNPAGLERVGNNLYASTPNSGDFDGIGEEAAGGTSLLPGVLEMSNVDLAAEFTEMITTQRGFQANSRVITTSDEMLQELVGLKR